MVLLFQVFHFDYLSIGIYIFSTLLVTSHFMDFLALY